MTKTIAEARDYACVLAATSPSAGVQALAVDESDAASPFLDIRARAYSPEFLDLYDMPWGGAAAAPVRDDEHRVAGCAQKRPPSCGSARTCRS
ncbi:MAG: hypothetical protein M3467_09500 [Actinomycetota bacterium]|nr:hypothetical protein [Actinomycetota bacterium]